MTSGEYDSGKKGNRFYRYLDYTVSLISKYKGGEPFHLFLKKYFAANKKHGSRDRKMITSLCYNYFRLGNGVSSGKPVKEKLLLGLFLAEGQSSPMLESLKPEWNEMIGFPVSDKLEIVKDDFNVDGLFPFHHELSNDIDTRLFNLSFLKQPKLFTRIRPGQHKKVLRKLKAAAIPFEQINTHCLAFPNTQKISEILKTDEEIVIQDHNSQRVGEFFKSEIANLKSPIALWDCCAGSGGKSILAYDVLQNVDITVSDTRKNILENLKNRFGKAGIKNYQSFTVDLSKKPKNPFIDKTFNLIIADVPCSGSGTWGRTPEQIHFFSNERIEKYTSLQKSIAENSISYLENGGHFLYVTCSVFKKENEDNVEFIQNHLNLELIDSRYLKGYEMQADTLFAAMFRKA